MHSRQFEQQRAVLVGEIVSNLESVLQNMNTLNRSLEGIISVGTEFGQVEGLWSRFETVMAKDQGIPAAAHGSPAQHQEHKLCDEDEQ